MSKNCVTTQWRALWLVMAVLVCPLHSTSNAAQASHLTTDDMNVLGDATFFGNVTISSGEAVTNNQHLYYSFDTTNATVADDSGNAHTGTIFSAVWATNGVSVNCMDFTTPTNARVNFTADFMLGVTGCTYIAWIRLNGNPGDWQEVIGSVTNTGAGDTDKTPVSFLWMNKNSVSTNVNSVMYMSTSGVPVQVHIPCGKPTTYFQDSQWHFVALVWNGTTARHYIDGIYDVSTTTPTGSLLYTNRASVIGNTFTNGQMRQSWKGQIDEVRIYKRSLSENELKSLWAKGANGGTVASLIVNRIDATGGVVQTSMTATNAFMGKTGIGTTTPAEQLDVNGKLQMEDNIKLNGHWLSSDGDNEGTYVATNGSVGVGTSSPSNTLHVAGTLRADSGVTYVAPLSDVSMGIFTNAP